MISSVGSERQVTEPCNFSVSSSESESGEEDSSNEDECVQVASEVLACAAQGRRAARDPGDDLYQHVVNRTLHIVKRFELRFERLACGRLINESFERLEFIPTFDWPKCKTCFGTA